LPGDPGHRGERIEKLELRRSRCGHDPGAASFAGRPAQSSRGVLGGRLPQRSFVLKDLDDHFFFLRLCAVCGVRKLEASSSGALRLAPRFVTRWSCSSLTLAAIFCHSGASQRPSCIVALRKKTAIHALTSPANAAARRTFFSMPQAFCYRLRGVSV